MMQFWNRSLRMTIAAAGLVATQFAVAAPVTVQPMDGKDAQIADGSLADANFGGSTDLITNWSSNLRSIGLLEFDLSAYAGRTVSAATLGLYHAGNTARGATYSVFRVTSAWAEGMVTFNTAPTIEATPVASLTIGDDASIGWRDWDIADLVNGWLAGTYANYGLWIEETPIAGDASAYFKSSDSAGLGPRLVFDLVDVAEVPEPASLALVGLGLAGLAASRRRKQA